jgi:methionine sulfoxide reductase heme-binding subunit
MTRPWFGLTSGPWWVAVGVALVPPLAVFGVVTAILIDLFWGTRLLGTNPVKAGEHALGEWTIRLLFASLAVTPLRRLAGWNWLARHRRTLGLYAFLSAVLHFTVWLLLDLQAGVSDYVGWETLETDLTKRPYLIVGMTALLLMTPLAITSTQGMIRRLGRRWQRLHRLAYLIAILGVIHWGMSVKKDLADPILGGLVLAGLLGFRVWEWRRRTVAPAA